MPDTLHDIDQRPPTETPWGTPQGGWKKLAGGIYSCSTASHGGFWLSEARYQSVPAELRALNWNGIESRFFEEDSDWALVVRAFPDEFDQRMRDYAERDRLWREERAQEKAHRS